MEGDSNIYRELPVAGSKYGWEFDFVVSARSAVDLDDRAFCIIHAMVRCPLKVDRKPGDARRQQSGNQRPSMVSGFFDATTFSATAVVKC